MDLNFHIVYVDPRIYDDTHLIKCARTALRQEPLTGEALRVLAEFVDYEMALGRLSFLGRQCDRRLTQHAYAHGLPNELHMLAKFSDYLAAVTAKGAPTVRARGMA